MSDTAVVEVRWADVTRMYSGGALPVAATAVRARGRDDDQYDRGEPTR
ncbi:hypothetical protein ACIA6D_28950 [Streptomyces cacaoi]